MTKPSSNPFCWHELATPDLNSTKKFYNKLLGWQFTELNINHTTYIIIILNNKEFGGMWQIPPDKKQEIKSQWISYLSVNNLEDTLQQAIKLGATIQTPLTPVGNYGQFAVIADPTGVPVAFWESFKTNCTSK
ncbi:VOC family protein [Legionella sp. D16C41]|uniref:VOC family protein n=1 Tax=Legionella sp. D16C41 TaxID=3402688 RepID=UPI003AF50DE1